MDPPKNQRHYTTILSKPEKSFSFLFYYHLLIYTAPLLRNKGFMLDDMIQE